MMRLLALLLVVGIGYCGFLYLNNRVSYKYEADVAETLVKVQHGSPEQLQKVRSRGQELDNQLWWIKVAMVAQATGLVVLLVRLNRPSPTV